LSKTEIGEILQDGENSDAIRVQGQMRDVPEEGGHRGGEPHGEDPFIKREKKAEKEGRVENQHLRGAFQTIEGGMATGRRWKKS